MMRRFRLVTTLLAIMPAVGVLTAAGPAAAGTDGWLREMREGFYHRIEILGSGTYIDVETASVNAGNLLGLPRTQAAVHLRPDLELRFRRLRLGAKPRYELHRDWFEEGPRRGTSATVDSLFVNEWLAEFRFHDALFASVGRENLQWGPSYLISPSNPFNRGNGENNPRLEEPGLDYAKALWIPGSRWAVSAIANVGEGRLQSFRRFVRGYALKVDHTGEGHYAGAVLSVREEKRPELGGFAGASVSDALLLYAEGASGEGFGAAEILLGGSYTFFGGAFLAAEIFHDESGCTAGRIEDCLNPLRGTADPADVLFRRNYVLIQATHPHFLDRASVTGRWILGLDDGSHRAIGIYEQGLTDRLQAFAIGAVDLGGTGDEFGSVFAAAIMAGLSWVL